MLSLQLIDGLEAGTDEAGRGCLAGPVTAAAVILPADFNEPLLNDSKKLTEKQRFYLRPIIEKHAVAFAVAHCTPKKVDEINILNAAIKAMHKAIQKLKPTPIPPNPFHNTTADLVSSPTSHLHPPPPLASANKFLPYVTVAD